MADTPSVACGGARLRRFSDDPAGDHLPGHHETDQPPLPLMWVLLAGWLLLSFAGGQVLGSLAGEGSSDRHRWAHEQAERERQWALQRQLRELERQIQEERLPEEEREAIRERRRRDTEIQREARRRLGLPEEDEANG